MSKDSVIDSLGRIDDTMIESVEKLRQKPRRKRVWVRWVAAAACLAVLAVSAEASNGFVSNLLAPLYGGAQTELVNNIGVPVGASATVNGYTLTAEAIIGDRYNCAIVYTLCREDGQVMPKGIMFDQADNTLQESMASRMVEYQRSEDGLRYQIIDQWASKRNVLRWRYAKAVFTDLVIFDGSRSLLQEGTWELNFTVRYKDTAVRLPVHDLGITGSEGHQYEINKVYISPIGMYIDMTTPVRALGVKPLEDPMTEFCVSVILADDSQVDLRILNYGVSVEYGEDVQTQEIHYGTIFKTPIPLDTIKAIVICDKTIEVDLS